MNLADLCDTIFFLFCFCTVVSSSEYLRCACWSRSLDGEERDWNCWKCRQNDEQLSRIPSSTYQSKTSKWQCSAHHVRVFSTVNLVNIISVVNMVSVVNLRNSICCKYSICSRHLANMVCNAVRMRMDVALKYFGFFMDFRWGFPLILGMFLYIFRLLQQELWICLGELEPRNS